MNTESIRLIAYFDYVSVGFLFKKYIKTINTRLSFTHETKSEKKTQMK